jgi:tRNA:m4X modification enzyme
MNPYNSKHARQQASLVGNMAAAGLLEGAPRTAYVELGAGKGWLSAWLAGASGARHLLLVDRARGLSAKADRRLRHTALTRATLDLRDLDVGGLLAHHAAVQAQRQVGGERAAVQEGATPQVEPLPCPCPWVAYGKHLCGAATDMALRACLTALAKEEAQPQQPASAEDGAAGRQQQQSVLRGVCIATCCHHRCSWRTFVGKRQLANFGIAPWDFEVLAYATSWALCGHAAPAGEGGASGSEDERGEEPDEDRQEQPQPQQQPQLRRQPSDQQQQELSAAFDPRSAFPTREARMAFGLRCKQLIDAARAAQLVVKTPARGRPPRLLRYIPPSVSGESTALLWAPGV